MSIINYLKVPAGANKKTKRRGRGQGSGHGKTACRGHKGQSARGNTKKYKGVEGGQMPLARRLPKRGFAKKSKAEYQLVNTQMLNSFTENDIVFPELYKKKGFIKNTRGLVKVLNSEKLKKLKKLEVHAHSFSKSAKAAIKKAGGKALIIAKTPAVKGKI
jgi:large subunit ribosomal protein L15